MVIINIEISFAEQCLEIRKTIQHDHQNLSPNRTLAPVIDNNYNTEQQRKQRSDLSKTDCGSSSSTFTFNARTPISQDHVAYCSYVQDGPSMFSVHLKHQDYTLEKMSFEFANTSRIPIKTKMTVGMLCMATYSKDKILYRAVIRQIQANGFRIEFIDYGNSELVSITEIFEIPRKFVELEALSTPFQLADFEQLLPIDETLERIF